MDREKRYTHDEALSAVDDLIGAVVEELKSMDATDAKYERIKALASLVEARGKI